MNKANCKTCGPLPVGDFYLSKGKPMNVCKVHHRKRTTKAQRSRRAMYQAAGLRITQKETRPVHGLNAFWCGCRCEVCRNANKKYEQQKYLKRLYGLPKTDREAVQLKLFVETQIRLLTKHGASRNAIKEATNAPWDLIGDTLAEMWDKGEVFTRKHGNVRLFYLKAA